MVHKTTASKAARVQPHDHTVTRVMVALLLLVVSVFLLGRVSAAYTTLDGFDRIYPACAVVAIVALVLAVACVVVRFVVRQNVCRLVAQYLFPLLLLAAFSALVLRKYLTDQMPLLYFVHAAVYCLYIIFQLYRAEFFTISLVTTLAGWTFYRSIPGFSVFWAVLLVLVAALTAGCAWLVSKQGGALRVSGRKLHLFPSSFSPLVIYVTCALWLVCLIAGALLGSLFSYYCMFAAIAFELIAAVYYTFQLK